MRSGSLRHRITLQSKSATRGTYGEEVILWTTFATVWASIEPLSARELIEQGRAEAETTHRIRIRYRDGVVPSMRVEFEARTFEITSVINWTEMDRELILICRELSRL